MYQQARIVSIDGDRIECAIDCGDACGGCKAKSVCSGLGGESSNKKILSLISTNPNHKVGDVISVEISTAMGLRAVLLAYMLPVVLVIGLLLLLQSIGLSELWSGISALGALILYFVVIKVFGIGRSISVSIVEDHIND